MDNDVYGHVNNVVYYSFFDTAVNRYLIEAGALDIHHGAVIGLVVETHCNYFAPLAFPQLVDAGLRVAHVGALQRALRGRPVRRRRAADGRAPATSCMSTSTAPAAVRRRCPAAAARCSRCATLPDQRLARPTPHDDHPRDHRRGRCRDHLAPLDARLPAHAGAARDDRGRSWTWPRARHRAPTPSRGRCTVLTGERQAAAVGGDPRRLRRPGRARAPHRGVRLLPDRVGLALHRPPPQGGLGPVRAARHRQDRQGAHARAARRNYDFFDAPVGLIFTHRPRACSRAAGSTTACSCRTSWSRRARAASTPARRPRSRSSTASSPQQLALPETETVVCGMALGHADPAAVENTLVTAREPVAAFTRFLE